MRLLPTILSFIWSGLILGISFMEAPLKFQAPNITTELGLGIGKLVFTALNRMELVLASIILISLIMTKPATKYYYLFGIPMFILLLQTFFLLPYLDWRVDEILAGREVPHSYAHIIFILFEVIKLLTLWYVATVYLKSITK